MLNDDQLGEILRRELHAVTTDVHPSGQLMRDIVALPRSGTRGWLRPRILAPALVAAAAITVIVVLLVAIGGPRPSPAFAFTAASGKSVRVTLAEITNIKEANEKLSVLGHVRVLPMTDTCKTSTAGINYALIGEHPTPRISLGSPRAGRSTTMVVAAKQTTPNRVILAIGSVTGNVPACISAHGTGPGLPGWHP